MWGVEKKPFQEWNKEKNKTPSVVEQQKNLTQIDEKKANTMLASVVDKIKQNATLVDKIKQNATLVDKIKQNPTVENPAINQMFDQIDKNETLKDAEWNKISQLLKEWKIMQAIEEWFKIIMWSIFGDKNKQTELFFPQFKHLDADIAKLDLSHKSLSELEGLRTLFDDKIASADSVKRKISYTYMVSKIIDQYERVKDPNTNWLQIIEKQLTVWSVLLLNKKNAWVWWKMLQAVWAEDIDMTHVIVITEKWPPIKFSHATEHKFGNSSQSWVEVNVPLWEYLKWSYADVVITNPPEANKAILQQRVQNLSADEKNYTYSKTAAAKWIIWVWVGGDEKTSWKFNCWTYVQEVLWVEGKELAVPGNWLKDSKLKPSYMFTFEPDKQGS
jgi:hypothetical protein